MAEEERFLAAMDAIYGAALDDAAWPGALESFRDLAGARSAYLILADPVAGEIVFSAFAGDAHDPMPPPLASPGQVVSEPCTCGEHFQAALSGPGRTQLLLGGIRRDDARPLPAERLACAQELLSHFERAVAISRELAESSCRTCAAELALDAEPLAVLLLNVERRVVASNRRARLLVEKGDALRVRDGLLTAVRPADNDLLQRLLRDAVDQAPSGPTSDATCLPIQSQDGLSSLTVSVAPMSAPPRDVLFAAAAPVAAVFVHDPHDMPSLNVGAVASLHGLTNSEARLAVALAEGMTVKEYAEAAGVTENTARWTLKQVLSKTNTRRQPELVRLILTGLAKLSLPGRDTARSPPARPPDEP